MKVIRVEDDGEKVYAIIANQKEFLIIASLMGHRGSPGEDCLYEEFYKHMPKDAQGYSWCYRLKIDPDTGLPLFPLVLIDDNGEET